GDAEPLDCALPALTDRDRYDIDELAVLEDVGYAELLIEHPFGEFELLLATFAAAADLHLLDVLLAETGLRGHREREKPHIFGFSLVDGLPLGFLADADHF